MGLVGHVAGDVTGNVPYRRVGNKANLPVNWLIKFIFSLRMYDEFQSEVIVATTAYSDDEVH